MNDKFEVTIRVKRESDGSYKEQIYSTYIPRDTTNRDLAPDALRAASVFQGLVGEVREIPLPKPECKGFRWIGQPLKSCDACGLPIWEHDMLETIDREGPFLNPPKFKYDPIPESAKKRHKRLHGVSD